MSNAFAAFPFCNLKDSDEVRVLEQEEKIMVIEVRRKNKIHYELYWVVEKEPPKSNFRDTLGRLGHDIIIKVFYFDEFEETTIFRQFVLEDERFDPTNFYKLEFLTRWYLEKNPMVSKDELQRLL